MINLSQGILAVLWVLMALWHSFLIKHNRPIKHGWWSVISAALIFGAAVFVWPHLPGRLHHAEYLAAQGISRLVVFNVSLNLFRRLSWDYSSPTSTSILDLLERRLFGGRVWLLEVILACVFFILQYFL